MDITCPNPKCGQTFTASEKVDRCPWCLAEIKRPTTTQPADVGYWSVIEPVWLKLNRTWDESGKKFLRLFRSIPPQVGHLYAASWCQAEVCNGGLHQFLSNTTGLLAPEAVEGFRAIGLPELAEVVAEAMEFFGTPYPRGRADRDALLASRPGRTRKQWDPFQRLDERFYEWSDR
jgi:hypothetical protein